MVSTVGDVNVVYASVLESVDQRIWEFFVERDFLTGLARGVTNMGVLPVLIPVALVLGAYVWKRTGSVLMAVLPWLTMQITFVVVASLKDWTAVTRPPREFWIVEASAHSFPSGHVANTTALVSMGYLLVSEIHPSRRRAFAIASFVVVALMAWSRLALNVHWLSDVVAGALIGVVSALMVLRLSQRIKSQRGSQPQTPG